MGEFIRFQSAVPNRRGQFPGVFAMANGLRDEGLLSKADERWLQIANANATSTYTDPTTVATDCYNAELNPGARSWFKAASLQLLDMTAEYLNLLDRHGIPWMALRSDNPGRLVYEDAVQVVAVPHTYPEHWPFRPAR
ncbi:hypothetical protein J7E83_18840 [Arthrobacter sp. ISL-48]|uniref:hypothetical protein n=1 Tax=Arthrobacter sp. ISL-48 TaxID=2819110 RepID=UPI001BEC4F6A|nr:hypothetical protein [Arthrobacter sp. ISL-48]MBT2534142.1 hypothetical protein [Arthrobacter sp. ISL-48]